MPGSEQVLYATGSRSPGVLDPLKCVYILSVREQPDPIHSASEQERAVSLPKELGLGLA